jgi:trafficking protein particle complex subunit 8
VQSQETLSDLQLPFAFCLKRQTRLRLPRENVNGKRDAEWEKREDNWRTFWKNRGGESLHKSGKAVVNGELLADVWWLRLTDITNSEIFWVELVLRNPLDTEVNLSNLTIAVQETNSHNAESAKAFVDVETISDVILAAREIRTVCSIQDSLP